MTDDVMTIAWRTLASRTILKDRWMDLRVDDCATPTGHRVSPYYVLTYPDWVHVVAVTDDTRIVLVRQYRHGAGLVTLELPGGTSDAADSDPLVTAQRELEEETGYVADRWEPVVALSPNPALQTNRVHIFLARGARPDGTRKLDASEEGLTVECVPLDTLRLQLRQGLLINAMHVAGLLLALDRIDAA